MASRYTITVVEHVSAERYRSGAVFGSGTEVVREDIERYRQTVDRLDIEAVIESANRNLTRERDKAEDASNAR